MKIIDELDKAFDYLLSQPSHLLALRLTLLLFIFYGGIPSPFLGTLLKILCGIMIIYTPLTTSGFMWIIISAIQVFYNVFYWVIFPNPHYLITYWSITCTVVVFSEDPESVMKWNAKILIGLCFLFAAAWKLIGGDYLDGTLQHFVFLIDRRLENFSYLFGLGKDALAQNRALLGFLREAPGEGVGVTLKTTPGMHLFSVITSYWTILIESSIAVFFLLSRPKWSEKLRNLLLIVFVISTYFFFPVPSFAFIIALLGFAQCSNGMKKTRVTYLILLAILPLSTLPMLLPKLIETFTSYLLSFTA